MDLVHLNLNTEQLHSHFYWLTVIIVIMACWLHASAANTVCPNELPQFSPADTPRDKVFLDVQNPVYCNGTVTGWRVCYYSPEPAPEETKTYSVIVGAWRKVRILEFFEWYTRLKYEVIRRQGSQLQQGFHCITLSLASEGMFEVEVGDIVGFYTLNDDLGDNEILNLGASTNATQTWYIAQRSLHGSCQFSDVSYMLASCFDEENYIYGTAMHVSVILEQGEFLCSCGLKFILEVIMGIGFCSSNDSCTTKCVHNN